MSEIFNFLPGEGLEINGIAFGKTIIQGTRELSFVPYLFVAETLPTQIYCRSRLFSLL